MIMSQKKKSNKKCTHICATWMVFPLKVLILSDFLTCIDHKDDIFLKSLVPQNSLLSALIRKSKTALKNTVKVITVLSNIAQVSPSCGVDNLKSWNWNFIGADLSFVVSFIAISRKKIDSHRRENVTGIHLRPVSWSCLYIAGFYQMETDSPFDYKSNLFQRGDPALFHSGRGVDHEDWTTVPD